MYVKNLHASPILYALVYHVLGECQLQTMRSRHYVMFSVSSMLLTTDRTVDFFVYAFQTLRNLIMLFAVFCDIPPVLLRSSNTWLTINMACSLNSPDFLGLPSLKRTRASPLSSVRLLIKLQLINCLFF